MTTDSTVPPTRFSYTTDELHQWIANGDVPKELAEYQLKRLEEMNRFHQDAMHLSSRCKAESRDPTQEEWLSIAPERTTSDISADCLHMQQWLEFLAGRHQNALSLIPAPLFKNLSPNEYGISKLYADRIAYIQRLVQNLHTSHRDGTTYELSSEIKDASGNAIILMHWFDATSPEEADTLADGLRTRFHGVVLKVLHACWKTACDKGHQFRFRCSFVDLMRAAYPERMTDFSSEEKLTFFTHLRTLERTKLQFRRRESTKRGGLPNTVTIEMPLLQIVQQRGREQSACPDEITICVMDLNHVQGSKTAFAPAKFKRSTLELHADNINLAQSIQVRASQNQQTKTITYDRVDLIRLAGLEGTDASHRPMANKRLREQLDRLRMKGIILEYPQKITDRVVLRIR